jgi:ribosomal protein S18 acetylase RimI-like enzyme
MRTPGKGSRESYPGTKLRRVNWSRDIDTVRQLFRDYREWLAEHRDTASSTDSSLNIGLGKIDQLIAELPGAYGPPRGEIILALTQEEVVACGALRELEPKVAEIKRIYVRADHRGPGFGPRLTRALLDRAEKLGYERVRVDTLPTMTAAIQFYQEMGFDPIPPYWPHPVPGALFFEYTLRKPVPVTRRDDSSSSMRLVKSSQ